MRSPGFVLSVLGLTLAELTWFAMIQADIPRAWLNTPPSIPACFVLGMFAIVLPALMLAMLWIEQANLIRFSLLMIAAATFGYGSLAVIGIAVVIMTNGLPFTDDMLPGIACAVVSALCLTCWKAMGSPEQPSAMTA